MRPWYTLLIGLRRATMNKHVSNDFDRIRNEHMAKGVILIDPSHTYIENNVEIGEGTTMYPGCYIHSGTKIGTNCVLYPNVRIENSTIGDDVVIESSVVLDSTIGTGTKIGPFAYIRPNSHIGENCRIGDFVEIKNSTIADHTAVAHLTYVGDGDVGSHVNIGCGTVFVNYDGKIKQRTTVEDGAFIGCNSNLIAPVRIEKDAYIAAGSTVTQRVPPKALYIARARGVVKENWVETRNKKES
ncbi:MAG: hypothetical protein GX786_02995 [Clostridiales bacterium]|nr:hypothetical protein [Clostridiales bacterium]